MYTAGLLILLYILAVKTRNVKHGDFKDTKKTNLLVGCLLVLMISSGLLWGILRQARYYIFSYVSSSLLLSLHLPYSDIFISTPSSMKKRGSHIQTRLSVHTTNNKLVIKLFVIITHFT